MNSVYDTVVLGACAKNYWSKHGADFTAQKLSWVWFMIESARIPDYLVGRKILRQSELPTFWDSVWWEYLMDHELSFAGMNRKQMEQFFSSEIKPKLIELVQWGLTNV